MLKTLIVLALALLTSAATADTYNCTSVKDRATLGYDGSAKVSVVGKDDVCTFSIGGASVDTHERIWTFEDEQRDFEMFSQDPERFIDERLIDLLRMVADIHGERGDFLLDAVDGMLGAPQIDCFEGNSDQLGKLRITCRLLGDEGFGSVSQFESGIMFAQVSRPRFVIAVEDDFSGQEGAYIFLTRLR